MPVTDIGPYQQKGFPGQYVPDKSKASTGVNNTPTTIPYGRAVVLGTPTTNNLNDRTQDIALPSSAGQTFMGILGYAPFTEDISYSNPNGDRGLPEKGQGTIVYETPSILVQVEAGVTVTPSADVYFRHTPNGANKLNPGEFLITGDSGNADQITNARWKNTFQGPGLAELELFGGA